MTNGAHVGQDRFDITVVVGNPKPASRTRGAACRVAERIAESVLVDEVIDIEVVELSELASQLFDWSAHDVRAAVDRVSSSRLTIVATPVYKASYTGLLKAFLDWFSDTSLERVVAIPTMVGATPRHALAVEHHLRPTLVELGAALPTRGLFVLEDELERVDRVIDAWLAHAQLPLEAMLTSDRMRDGR